MHSELNDPSRTLRNDWEEDQLEIWKDGLGRPIREISVGSGNITIAGKSLLSGEKCASCKPARASLGNECVDSTQV